LVRLGFDHASPTLIDRPRIRSPPPRFPPPPAPILQSLHRWYEILRDGWSLGIFCSSRGFPGAIGLGSCAGLGVTSIGAATRVSF
ncbi:unnamed protein product, partial [Musa hybrid cultivar]